MECRFGVNSECAQHSVHPIPGNVRRGYSGGSLRVFKRLSGLKFFPLPNLIQARPRAGNASRWAAFKSFLTRKVCRHPILTRKECVG
jgi:hypothetical protein